MARPKRNRGIPCQDHLGKEYPSIEAMCRAHGVLSNVYRKRLKKGMNQEEALKPAAVQHVPCTGPDGKEYPTIAAMCRANGLNRHTVSLRIWKHGTDYEHAFVDNVFETEDHEGRKYPSVKAMAEAYGITADTYYDRIRNGYTKEQALTAKPGELRGRPAADFDGREFRNATQMCRYWNVDHNAVTTRMRRHGDTMADALKCMIERSWPGRTINGIAVIKAVQWPWFLCGLGNGAQAVLSAGAIIEGAGA